ncbi:hypothetical protein HDU92_005652 [Lobulomyces angularis]|nr:hypothetical protein HDU92_005652 [Lobulomyces angularis]
MYKVSEQLVSSSFSNIYLAIKNSTLEEVVIKSVFTDADSLEQAKNEISLLSNLSHKNVVKMLDYRISDDQIALVLEYVVGGDLFDLLTKQKLNSTEQKLIFKQLTEGILYLHTLNVVHRDLKLENILLSRKNNLVQQKTADLVKICDFGLAHEVDESIPKGGSDYYLAPELITSSDTSNSAGIDLYKVDTWALGVILFALMTGELPFYGKRSKLFLKIAIGKYNLPTSAEIDDDGKDLVKNLLQTNPSCRFNAQDILNHRWFK